MINKKIKFTAETIPNAFAIISANFGKTLNTSNTKEKKIQNNFDYQTKEEKNLDQVFL